MAGQVVASLVLDHFGMFGLVERQVTVSRGVGALLLVAGMVLIQFSATPAKAVIAAS
jgi:transporter family-2 protein